MSERRSRSERPWGGDSSTSHTTVPESMSAARIRPESKPAITVDPTATGLAEPRIVSDGVSRWIDQRERPSNRESACRRLSMVCTMTVSSSINGIDTDSAAISTRHFSLPSAASSRIA